MIKKAMKDIKKAEKDRAKLLQKKSEIEQEIDEISQRIKTLNGFIAKYEKMESDLTDYFDSFNKEGYDQDAESVL